MSELQSIQTSNAAIQMTAGRAQDKGRPDKKSFLNIMNNSIRRQRDGQTDGLPGDAPFMDGLLHAPPPESADTKGEGPILHGAPIEDGLQEAVRRYRAAQAGVAAAPPPQNAPEGEMMPRPSRGGPVGHVVSSKFMQVNEAGVQEHNSGPDGELIAQSPQSFWSGRTMRTFQSIRAGEIAAQIPENTLKGEPAEQQPFQTSGIQVGTEETLKGGVKSSFISEVLQTAYQTKESVSPEDVAKPAINQEPQTAQEEPRSGEESKTEPMAAQAQNKNVQLPDVVTIQTQGGEKANVKVGDPVNIYEPGFSDKVAEKIILKQSDGARQFDIELYPKELGKINISIMFKAGKAVVSMICENPKTQYLLSAHAQSIRNIVESNTGNQTTVDIKKDENPMDENYDGRGQQQSKDQGRQTPQKNETDTFIHQIRLGMLTGD